ncbi:MAG TPA: EAL domain-containing protein [Solirubrobacteraceae bacterium]|jgi:EAL and modified HD-GYP domain-containing signal transduction protein
MSNAYVARQPIFDRDLEVVGYELLFRDPPVTVANVSDHQAATTRVVLDTLTELGLDQVVGTKLAWINVSRGFLLDGLVSTLPHDRVGIEILENQLIDDELVAAVIEAREQGFSVALDDFELGTDSDRLLEHVDFIKLDLMALGRDGLTDHVARLRHLDAELLVEKVETHEDHAFASALGCHRFQGFFYRRPELLSSRRIDVGRVSLMRLLCRLQDPSTTLEEIQNDVSLDIGLSLRLLRYINSASVGMPHVVSSVAQAVTLLGPGHLRRWASLTALAGLANERSELTRTALVRAHFCELAAHGQSSGGPQRFTLGLFSVMDALTDSTLQDALAAVPFPTDMREALVDHTGPLGRLLGAVIALEEGSFDLAEALYEHSGEIYMDALAWADATVAALDNAAAPAQV